MTFISRKFWQFRYFDTQLGRPTWGGRDVLDFGGNVGNILKEPKSTIDHDKYWCIDVSRTAIKKARETYPHAHWIFYDRYNLQFNPTGIPGLEIPDIEQKFDYILAYSVFTHTSKAEMIELVNHLEMLLKGGGILAFTFGHPQWIPPDWRPHYRRRSRFPPRCNLQWWLERRKVGNVEALMEKAKNAAWCTLVNDRDLYVDCENERHYEAWEKKTYMVFYTAEYMKTIFPDAEVLPPVQPERQHCCVIKKG